MIKLLEVVSDKLHTEADACIRAERESFQLHLPIKRFPACIPAWWLFRDLMVGLWPAGLGAAGTPYAATCHRQHGAALKARAVVPMQEMLLPSPSGQQFPEL